MAKPLDPKAIEAERQTSSRAERREQKRRQMQDEISYNQRGNGVIIIPPQKRRELAEEPPKLRVAAYCRVSTQEEQQVGSFDMQIHHFTKRIEANPQWELLSLFSLNIRDYSASLLGVTGRKSSCTPSLRSKHMVFASATQNPRTL